MLGLLFLPFMLFVFFSVARAAGRRRMLEEARRRELERRARDGAADLSPFAGLP